MIKGPIQKIYLGLRELLPARKKTAGTSRGGLHGDRKPIRARGGVYIKENRARKGGVRRQKKTPSGKKKDS